MKGCKNKLESDTEMPRLLGGFSGRSGHVNFLKSRLKRAARGFTEQHKPHLIGRPTMCKGTR